MSIKRWALHHLSALMFQTVTYVDEQESELLPVALTNKVALSICYVIRTRMYLQARVAV